MIKEIYMTECEKEPKLFYIVTTGLAITMFLLAGFAIFLMIQCVGA